MKVESIDRWETVATVILLLSAAGSIPIYPPVENSSDPLGGSLAVKLVAVLTYLIMTGVLLRHWKRMIYVGTRNLWVLLLLGCVVCSVLWSSTPDQTLSSARGLLRNSFIGIYLASRYSLREQLRLLAWVLGITALLSLIISLFFSRFGYGVHSAPEFIGYWTGVYFHKNLLGPRMCWSAAIFLSLALSSSRYRGLLWFGFFLSSFLIIKSHSTSSLGILLSMIALLPFYKLIQNNNYRLQVISTITAIYLFVGGSVWLQSNLENVLSASGKDLTLTGRTQMWSDLIDVIAKQPLLGYGFDGFYGSNIPDAIYIRSKYPWADHPHNGFIQLALGLGLLGLSLYIIGYIKYCSLALSKIIFWAKTVEDYWPMQMIVMITMSASSESTLLQASVQAGWGWIIYVATLLGMTVESRRMAFSRRISPSLGNQEFQ